MLIFFGGPVLEGGDAILDGVARLGPVFTFFAIGLFDTLGFHLSLAAWEASLPGRARGA
jgi:hypothetical protein